jgi:hypothetical protein
MAAPKTSVGEVVLYRPDKEDQRFKNVGHRPILPAIVVKVWDEVVDLQVLPVDLHVLQDAQAPITFVPLVRSGEEVGTWCHRT